MKDKILKTALQLIEELGWPELSFTDIASRAGVTLDQVYSAFPEKDSIITAFAQLLDKETLKNVEKFSENDTYRDKLFSVLMTRFDVAANYKGAIRRLWQNPLLAISTAPQGVHSMVWMLEAAQIDVSGAAGVIKAQLFGVFYLTAVNTWLHDESPDLAETMAYIDRGLERLEMVPGFY